MKTQNKTTGHERTIEDLKQDTDIKARMVKKLLSESERTRNQEVTNSETKIGKEKPKRKAIIIGD